MLSSSSSSPNCLSLPCMSCVVMMLFMMLKIALWCVCDSDNVVLGKQSSTSLRLIWSSSSRRREFVRQIAPEDVRGWTATGCLFQHKYIYAIWDTGEEKGTRNYLVWWWCAPFMRFLQSEGQVVCLFFCVCRDLFFNINELDLVWVQRDAFLLWICVYWRPA